MITNNALATTLGSRPHSPLIAWLSRLQTPNSLVGTKGSLVLEPWDIQVWLTTRTKCTHFILGDEPQLGTMSTVKVSVLYL